MKRAVLAPALGVVLALALAATATAHHRASTLAPLTRPAGCLASATTETLPCRVDSTLRFPGAAEPSPDGRFLYVTAPYMRYTWGPGEEMASGKVAAYAIDHSTGALTPIGCFAQGEHAEGCSPATGIRGARAMAISPDGRHLYLAAGYPGGVATFALKEDGTLAPLGCVNAGGEDSCTPGPASIEEVREVEVSPDGRHVYAASAATDAITIFSRAADTGALAPLGCISHDGSDGLCEDAHSLLNVADLEVTTDATRLYASGTEGIALFERDATTGELDQQACVNRHGPPTACERHFVGGPIALAPGTDDLYGATASGALVGLRRTTGGFHYQCLRLDLFGEFDCVYGAFFHHVDIAASSDGRSVYGAWHHINTGRGGHDKSVLFDVARDEASGKLRARGCQGDALQCAPGPSGVVALAAIPDSDLLYAVGGQLTALGPAAGVASSTARMTRRGKARIRIECPAQRAPACAGTLTARSVVPHLGDGSPSLPKIRTGVVLGTGTYELTAGSVGSFELTIRKRWRAGLRREQPLQTTVTASDRRGRTEPGGAVVTFVAPGKEGRGGSPR